MEVEIKDADPALFAAAVKHLEALGARKLRIFQGRTKSDGPWLNAKIDFEQSRFLSSTRHTTQGRTWEEQAEALAWRLERFEPY